MVSPLNNIQCPHRVDDRKFLHIGLHCCVHVFEFASAQYGNLLSFLLRCGTRPYERGTQYVLFILHGLFLRWEVSGCTAVIFFFFFLVLLINKNTFHGIFLCSGIKQKGLFVSLDHRYNLHSVMSSWIWWCS